jgi:hypothetical protein
MQVRPASPQPRPHRDAAGLRMLATLALATLAAAMIVLVDRTPADGADVHCFPYTEATRAAARAPSAVARPLPVAASRADARCLKIARAEAPADRPEAGS